MCQLHFYAIRKRKSFFAPSIQETTNRLLQSFLVYTIHKRGAIKQILENLLDTHFQPRFRLYILVFAPF